MRMRGLRRTRVFAVIDPLSSDLVEGCRNFFVQFVVISFGLCGGIFLRFLFLGFLLFGKTVRELPP